MRYRLRQCCTYRLRSITTFTGKVAISISTSSLLILRFLRGMVSRTISSTPDMYISLSWQISDHKFRLSCIVTLGFFVGGGLLFKTSTISFIFSTFFFRSLTVSLLPSFSVMFSIVRKLVSKNWDISMVA